MLIAIGSYPLCNGTIEGGLAATNLRLRFTRSIEVVQELGSSNPATFDRGTRTIDLSFTITRVHESIKEAEVFISKHNDTVPDSGIVALTTTAGEVAFIANGVAVEFQLISQIGSATFFSYRITGGMFFGIQPTPTDRPTTLNEVINTGIEIGLWPTITVPVPTTLTEVIDAGTSLGLWPSVPVPVTPTTLNEVIAGGTALNLWS